VFEFRKITPLEPLVDVSPHAVQSLKIQSFIDATLKVENIDLFVLAAKLLANWIFASDPFDPPLVPAIEIAE